MSEKDFDISLHAREQMLSRGIDEALVLQVHANPSQIVEEDDLEVYQSILGKRTRIFVARFCQFRKKSANGCYRLQNLQN